MDRAIKKQLQMEFKLPYIEILRKELIIFSGVTVHDIMNNIYCAYVEIEKIDMEQKISI